MSRRVEFSLSVLHGPACRPWNRYRCFTIFDIEDIIEEVAGPEDLIEDFAANPLMILFAFLAALADLFLFFLFLITLVLLVLAFGPVEVLVLLMVLSSVVVTGAVAAFLYVRTGVPSEVEQKIDNALEQADGSPEKEARRPRKRRLRDSETNTPQGTSTTTNSIRHSTIRSRARIPGKSSGDTRRRTARGDVSGRDVD